MRRLFVQACSGFAALMAAFLGVPAAGKLVAGGGWQEGLLAFWCVCIVVASVAALGRRG